MKMLKYLTLSLLEQAQITLQLLNRYTEQKRLLNVKQALLNNNFVDW